MVNTGIRRFFSTLNIPIDGIDPIVQLFVSSTYADITDSTIITALDDYIKSLRSTSPQGTPLIDYQSFMYPLVGDGNKPLYEQHNFELFDVANIAGRKRSYYSGEPGLTHDAIGVSYSSGYNQAIDPLPFYLSEFHANEVTLYYYSRAANNNANLDDMYSGTTVRLRAQTTDRIQFDCRETGVNLQATGQTDQDGLILGGLNPSEIYLLRNGTSIASQTPPALVNFIDENLTIGNAAVNQHGFFGGAIGMTSVEATAFTTILLQLATDLGKDV